MTLAQVHYHVALALWHLTRSEEALSAAELARSLQEEHGQSSELATTLTLIGAIRRARSEYDAALECHLQALAIAEQLGDRDAVARSHNNIGLIYWNLDRHEQAVEHLRVVLPIYRAAGKPRKLASALSNMGLIQIEMHQPQAALEYLREARGLAGRESEPTRCEALILGNIGFAYEELGDPGTAFGFYQQSLVLREQLGDRRGIARSLGSIAQLHLRDGDYERAASAYQRALVHAQDAGARSELAACALGLADAYQGLGRFEEALDAFRKHVEVTEELDRTETARRIAELEAGTAIAAKQSELDALEHERIVQELELSRQETRQRFLVAGSLLLLAATFGLVMAFRTRVRALAVVRRQHEQSRRTANELRESEERYRSVFEDSVVPRLIVDLERGSLIDANGPAGSLLQRDPCALRGALFDDVAPVWLADTIASEQSNEGPLVEQWQDARDETRWSEVWVTPLTLSDRRCAVVTVYDVTERHRIERVRSNFDKLESVGVLAGGIAHDFNNALAAILGNVSLARFKLGEEAPVSGLLEATEEAIDQATHLTAQLLAFSKGGGPRRELRDVRRLLWDATNFGLSGSGVQVEFDIASDLWAANLDEGQFKQAISNLVINAVQAMGGDGRLVVRARNQVVQNALARTARPGAHVLIEIQDSGPGIPAAILDRVMEPYFTTKDGGSGLGLATVFAVLSGHDGWVDIGSRVGEGAKFSLYFPASPEAAPGEESEAGLTLEGSGSILVMDDDPAVQRVFVAALTELGYTVEVVDDGQAAVDRWFAAKDEGCCFDAAIMDLTVPGGMGGKRAMAEIQRRDPNALVIVASGTARTR